MCSLRRAPIQYEDVFTAEGVLVKPDLLQQKLNGYVSYVRGENPYTFPFRIYPDAFAPDNNKLAKTPINTPLYYTTLDPYQQESYELIMREYMNSDVNIDFNNESYGYAQLQMPLQALIMTFPRLPGITNGFIGKEGMLNTMKFVEKSEKKGDIYEFRKYNYEYKKGVPRIFHKSELSKYSSKIANICQSIQKSRGIIIVYTQYIDGGIVAVALALEEMGFTRYGTSQTATPTEGLFFQSNGLPCCFHWVKPGPICAWPSAILDTLHGRRTTRCRLWIKNRVAPAWILALFHCLPANPNSML